VENGEKGAGETKKTWGVGKKGQRTRKFNGKRNRMKPECGASKKKKRKRGGNQCNSREKKGGRVSTGEGLEKKKGKTKKT